MTFCMTWPPRATITTSTRVELERDELDAIEHGRLVRRPDREPDVARRLRDDVRDLRQHGVHEAARRCRGAAAPRRRSPSAPSASTRAAGRRRSGTRGRSGCVRPRYAAAGRIPRPRAGRGCCARWPTTRRARRRRPATTTARARPTRCTRARARPARVWDGPLDSISTLMLETANDIIRYPRAVPAEPSGCGSSEVARQRSRALLTTSRAVHAQRLDVVDEDLAVDDRRP